MVCEDCGRLFRVDYDVSEDKELACPSCDSSNIVGIYKQRNIEERRMFSE